MVGANQPIHSFLGGKGLGIQQGTSVWVDSPKTEKYLVRVSCVKRDELMYGKKPLIHVGEENTNVYSILFLFTSVQQNSFAYLMSELSYVRFKS